MKYVAVIGSSGKINENLKKICKNLGKELGKRYTVLSGGKDGVMEEIAKGVNEVGGKIIGILPFDEQGNEFNSFEIKTGLDFQMRSFVIIKSADAVISIGGEIGTAIEILATYAYKKPLILFNGTGGWTDKVQKILIDGKFLDNRRLIEIKIGNNVKEILEFLKGILGE
ncbi:MAG: TIGR00725 family protein [Thermosipho sp. (in: Bacteria)]|nr:TIGR00725 family protein [Thermosipho sp. (in: thermotogales)]